MRGRMANAAATLDLMREAAKQDAVLAVFPELGLSAYSCEDLFHQQALIAAAEEALDWLLERSKALPLAAFVGLPVVVDGLLYNGAALLGLRGIVVKSHGSASDKGVANAIRVAARMVREDITRKIADDLAHVSAQSDRLVAAK